MAKIFLGRVVSNKSPKTVTVLIERKLRHPLYKKIITKHKRIKAHSEKKDLKLGDMVQIRETRPISKDKNFEVMEKISAK